MPTTSRGYPYPATNEGPNGPAAIQALADAVNADVGAIDAVLDGTAWAVATYQNSWANFGGAYSGAKYRVKGGVVFLKGLVKSGSLGTVFALPEGLRPLETNRWEVASDSGTAAVDVTATGLVMVAAYKGGGSNNSLSLSSISFPAEQ